MGWQYFRILYAAFFMQVTVLPPAFGVNTTIMGSLGDLDGNGDGGAGEDAIVQAATTCWDARVTTNRNFTLTVTPMALTGGTLGTGATSAVDGSNIPTAGFINIDSDGSTNWFVDTSPLDSLEFMPDPVSQWRFTGGPAQSDLWSTVHHEVGHAFGWLCGTTCGFTNPNYDALMVPSPGGFVANAACSSPFPLAGQAALPGCVHVTSNPFDVSLRGDGLGGSGSSVVNELSHPGIGSDLMEGFSSGGQRETPSEDDVDMFFYAYADSVNLPLSIDAGEDITAECSATGGADVSLDASGSTDPENDSLTYSWNCPGIVLSDDTAEKPTGFFVLDQTVSCRLDATDLLACAPDADIVSVAVVDTIVPDITCPTDILVECSAAGGTAASNPAIAAFLAGTGATDICDPSLSIGNDAPGFFNLGSTTVTFETSDDSNNSASCSASVEVKDATPPAISNVTATPDVLWPPNHKMVPVSLDVAVSDVCDGSAACQIVSVNSDEPLNGKGDGNTDTDWQITGDLSVNLRAERAGKGDGRIYTVGVECADGSGNTAGASVQVAVPHDKRKK